MDTEKPLMVAIPIPTEVPAPPSLDHLPLDVLHSATVEMLIQQNEDLSSRLKVNIRRNSQFEQKILELEKQISHKSKETELVKAQNEIILEKERVWLSQKEQKDRQLAALEKEIELLNVRYNELYSTSIYNKKQVQSELAAKQKLIERMAEKLAVYKKVRARAKEHLRHFLLSTAQDMNAHSNQIRMADSAKRILVKNFEVLKNEIVEKETVLRNQLENYKQTSTTTICTLNEKIHELTLLNSQMVERENELKTEINSLRINLHDEKKNRTKLSLISNELNELKNQKIRYKNEIQKVVERLDDHRISEEAKTKQLTIDIAATQASLAEQTENVKTCEQKILELSKDNTELSTQLESLQNLWMNAQEKLEKEELKRKSLEKINRELSQSFKDNKLQRAITKATEVDLEPITYPIYGNGPKMEV